MVRERDYAAVSDMNAYRVSQLQPSKEVHCMLRHRQYDSTAADV